MLYRAAGMPTSSAGLTLVSRKGWEGGQDARSDGGTSQVQVPLPISSRRAWGVPCQEKTYAFKDARNSAYGAWVYQALLLWPSWFLNKAGPKDSVPFTHSTVN